MEANPAKNQNTSLVAPARIEDWNRLSQSFQVISGAYSENVTDTSGSEPERLAGRRVAPRYFAVFETPALVGRVFKPEEEKFGGPLAAVISYRLWQRRYHGDARAIGKRLVLSGKGYTIVGVMPDGFASAGYRSVDARSIKSGADAGAGSAVLLGRGTHEAGDKSRAGAG